MDYDTILSEAGTAGFYQIMAFIILGFVNTDVNLENLAVSFLNPFHEHWCHVPMPDGANISYEEVSWGMVLWPLKDLKGILDT